jgi:hypothetical protein
MVAWCRRLLHADQGHAYDLAPFNLSNSRAFFWCLRGQRSRAHVLPQYSISESIARGAGDYKANGIFFNRPVTSLFSRGP